MLHLMMYYYHLNWVFKTQFRLSFQLPLNGGWKVLGKNTAILLGPPTIKHKRVCVKRIEKICTVRTSSTNLTHICAARCLESGEEIRITIGRLGGEEFLVRIFTGGCIGLADCGFCRFWGVDCGSWPEKERIGGLVNNVGLRILGDLHDGLRNFVLKRKDPRIAREPADGGFTDLMTRNVDADAE